MSKIWDWLNGNKTMIGNGLIAIAAHLPPETVVFDVPVAGVLYWIGGILSGVGLSHKAKKKFLP